MYKHILIPLDGSPFSEQAIEYGVELAKKFDARITLMKVVELTHSFMALEDPLVYADVRQAGIGQATRYLEEKKEIVEDAGVLGATYFIDSANVAASILESIEDLHIDLVAMSTHGRSGLDRLMFGSVAEKVVRHSFVPVLLIRPNQSD